MRLPRRDLAGLALAIVAAAVCVRLGVWQLHRLRERRAHNAGIRAARDRPPLEVTRAVPGDSVRERRLHVRGVYDYAHQRVWRGRTYEGTPGVALITPLRLADGAAVFVDRGWAASPDAYHLDERAYREPDTADVLGLGMLAPRGRGDVDPAKLRDSLPYPVLPFVMQLLPPPTVSDRPLPPGLLRWPAPEITDGPHLSYAIQWFSFAAIILVGSAVLVRKWVREGSRAGTPGQRPGVNPSW